MNLLKRFWLYLGTLGAPPVIAPPSEGPKLAPLPSDPVNDSNGHKQMAQQKKRQDLIDKFILHHNAYVVRDYGRGPEILVDTGKKHLSDVKIAGFATEFAAHSNDMASEVPASPKEEWQASFHDMTVAEMRADRAERLRVKQQAARLPHADPDPI